MTEEKLCKTEDGDGRRKKEVAPHRPDATRVVPDTRDRFPIYCAQKYKATSALKHIHINDMVFMYCAHPPPQAPRSCGRTRNLPAFHILGSLHRRGLPALFVERGQRRPRDMPRLLPAIARVVLVIERGRARVHPVQLELNGLRGARGALRDVVGCATGKEARFEDMRADCSGECWAEMSMS